MKKKLTSWLLVLAMVLTLFPTIAMAAGNSLQVSAGSLSGEDTITVTYTIPNSVTIGSLEVKISFDKGKLEATDVTWSAVPGFTAFTGSDATDANNNGFFSGSCYSSNLTDITVPANQTLVTANFKIKAGAMPGSAAFSVDELVIAELSGTDKTTEAGATTTGATVEVVSALSGNLPVTIAKPVVNQAPVTTLTDTRYSGTIAWDGSPSTFAADTVYTAEVELTAKTGYQFANGVNPTVTDATISDKSVSSDGKTLTFKAKFPATDSFPAASVGTAPAAKPSLKYTGSEQELVDPGAPPAATCSTAWTTALGALPSPRARTPGTTPCTTWSRATAATATTRRLPTPSA